MGKQKKKKESGIEKRGKGENGIKTDTKQCKSIWKRN